jgi:hypothetical protein
MIYVKINDQLYPATISGKMTDCDWNNRASKSITLKMDHNTAVSLFVDGLEWSIVIREEVPVYSVDEEGFYIRDENGKPIQVDTEVHDTEYDNSDYDVAGPITDNRDGTITAKMGKYTAEELLAMIEGAL